MRSFALVVVADVSGAGGVIGLLPDALGAALTADGARVAGGAGERDEGGEEGLGPGHATGRGGGAGELAVVLGLLPEAGLVAETVGDFAWPETPAGETVTADCPAGSEGTVTRVCGEDSVWGAPISDCVTSMSMKTGMCPTPAASCFMPP